MHREVCPCPLDRERTELPEKDDMASANPAEEPGLKPQPFNQSNRKIIGQSLLRAQKVAFKKKQSQDHVAGLLREDQGLEGECQLMGHPDSFHA